MFDLFQSIVRGLEEELNKVKPHSAVLTVSERTIIQANRVYADFKLGKIRIMSIFFPNGQESGCLCVYHHVGLIARYDLANPAFPQNLIDRAKKDFIYV